MVLKSNIPEFELNYFYLFKMNQDLSKRLSKMCWINWNPNA
jgi:hypothetical protein